ncbi:MAG: glycosyltransferase family 9 protein [Isosphaeraceae bacterium]|nr:glycosyltransferase family 9 protein [Isosphaeraceae bacterium]
MSRLAEPPRKVALVRASRVGDFVCATPAFRALRAAMPDAEVTLIGLPLVRELAERSPHLDRFESFPGYPGIAEQFFDARRTTRFFERMQAEGFDLAVQMQWSGVYANPFTLMLGAKVTAGFIREGDPPGRLDAALPVPRGMHEIRRLLALTTFLGVPPRGEAPEIALRPEDHAAAEALLAKAPRPLLGLHPSAREATKRWAPGRFAALGAALRRRHGGTILVLGGPEERPLAEAVACEIGGACLGLAGKTSLGVLGAVIARLALLVTNDSGPAHIAYALRTPTVTIFGGTDPAIWGPIGAGPHAVLAFEVACRPCDHADCPIGNLCLEGVTVPQALEAAECVLGWSGARIEEASERYVSA